MKDPKREFPEIMSFLEGYARRIFDIDVFSIISAKYIENSIRMEDRGITIRYSSQLENFDKEYVYVLSCREGDSDEKLLERTMKWFLRLLGKETLEEAILFLSSEGYM